MSTKRPAGRPREKPKIGTYLLLSIEGDYLGRMTRLAARLGIPRGVLLERWIDRDTHRRGGKKKGACGSSGPCGRRGRG